MPPVQRGCRHGGQRWSGRRRGARDDQFLPDVDDVSYYQTFVGYYQDPMNGLAVGAIDIERMLKVQPEIVVPEEQVEAMARTRTGSIVGRDLAEEEGWEIGDRVTVTSRVFPRSDGSMDWTFDIVGIYENSGPFEEFPANEMWINFDYFDEDRTRGNGRVLFYLIGISDPALAAPLSERIDAMFANSASPTQTLNEREFMRAQMAQIGDLGFFVSAIIGAVLFTLLFLTGNTMMQSVRERLPELAVLKTYGYGTGVLTALVFTESLLLCVFSAAIGIAVAALLFQFAMYPSAGLMAPMPLSVVAIGIGLAVVLAVISAVPPAFRAQRLNVVDALAGR